MSDNERDRLLQTILANVAFDGWTRRCLEDAARQEGLPPGKIDVLFPGGPRSAIEAFSHWADEQMLAAVEGNRVAFDGMRIREKIAFLVEGRLRALEPHREAVRRSLAVLAMPTNAGLASKLLYRAVDAMWRAAGDRSTDYNFYTKRVLLAGVYSSTQLYWLNDRSDDCTDSWSFLARRIEGVLKVGPRVGKLVGKAGKLSEMPFRVAASLRERVSSFRRTEPQEG
ncbi:MAG: COQ9 family protein [Pseudomonadota bacterium]